MLKWLQLILFMICASVIQLKAQKSYADHQLWFGASCKFDFKKGWELTAQYRAREIDNVTHYKGSYWFFTADYRINKFLDVFANYRYADVDVGQFHRYAIGAEARYKKHHFTYSMRSMVQLQNQYFQGDDEQNTDASLYLRLRPEIKYHFWRHWDVYVYSEPFINLKTMNRPDWWQNTAGMKYEFAKGQKLNLYYIWQPDYSKKHMRTYNIFSIDFDFAIKVGKKKEKEHSAKTAIESAHTIQHPFGRDMYFHRS